MGFAGLEALLRVLVPLQAGPAPSSPPTREPEAPLAARLDARLTELGEGGSPGPSSSREGRRRSSTRATAGATATGNSRSPRRPFTASPRSRSRSARRRSCAWRRRGSSIPATGSGSTSRRPRRGRARLEVPEGLEGPAGLGPQPLPARPHEGLEVEGGIHASPDEVAQPALDLSPGITRRRDRARLRRVAPEVEGLETGH